jgi:fructoselysine-6-P-deglycase FrlB-like protein
MKRGLPGDGIPPRADQHRASGYGGVVPESDAPGLADEITETGAHLVTASADPLVELVRAQRLAVAMARSRGLDPDHPRNLTRSVVLEGDGAPA